MQVVAPRSEIVIDEHRIRFAIGGKLFGNLLRTLHAIRHTQARGGQIAESAAIVTTTRGDEAGRGEETAPRKNRSPRRRVVGVFILVRGYVTRLKTPVFDITHNARPQLDSITQRQRVGV